LWCPYRAPAHSFDFSEDVCPRLRCGSLSGQNVALKVNKFLHAISLPSSTAFKDISPFLLASNNNLPDIVKHMLCINPTANINVTIAEGPNKGETPLLSAAFYQQWKLVQEILKNHPEVDVISRSALTLPANNPANFGQKV
jgi:hypothetical protein